MLVSCPTGSANISFNAMNSNGNSAEDRAEQIMYAMQRDKGVVIVAKA